MGVFLRFSMSNRGKTYMLGKRIDYLVVEEFVETKNNRTWWLCRCECGKEVIRSSKQLDKRSHNTIKSCGCKSVRSLDVLHHFNGTIIEQIQSAKLSKKNTSGYTGVYYLTRQNAWRVTIMTQGRRIYIGQFKDKSKAILARQEAEELYRQPILKEFENQKDLTPSAEG